MKHSLTLAFGLGMALSTPAAAKVVVADFDDLNNYEEVFCGKVENVTYCDRNKLVYGSIAPYLMLSDYDLWDNAEIVADPRTYFTPISFDFEGWSTLQRLYCPECAPMDSAIRASLWQRRDEFSLYDYGFLAVEGYRDGQLVAATAVGSADLGTVSLDESFAGITRLRFDLQGAYGEGLMGYEEDGYVYTCGYDVPYNCNEADIDNLVFRADVTPPAPIPVPATLPLLAAALGGLALLRRRA